MLDLTYDFHLANGDNGNVLQIVNNRDNNRTQNFTYDSLNRIKTAATQGATGSTCWGQMFGHMDGSNFVSGIDAWGNLNEITNTQCSALTLSQTSTVKNQISAFCYDIAGNLLSQAAACPNGLPYNPVYVYDAENRLRSINQSVTPYYTYDGDGKRVMKTYVANRLYWTGVGGDTLEETDGSGTAQADYIYFNGKRVARVDLPGGAVRYYFSDHLGTASVVTDNLGAIKDESDYYPYGGERTVTNTDSNRYKFTGKERDSESGLDNFGARYDASSLGRFMTPDAFYKDSHVGDPQSLNEYAYARNNPLRYVDPNGGRAIVSTTCTIDMENTQTTCTVNVSASIAIYAVPGSNITQAELDTAASTMQSSIQNAWTGSFTQDGVTYNVSTQVSVQVAASEGDASKTGAQNVIGLSNGPPGHGLGNAHVGRSNSLATFVRGQDTGIWNYNTLGADTKNTAAHEFTHLLGVDDHTGYVLSNTNPNLAAPRATPADLGWGIREATQSVGLGLSMKSWYNGSGGPLPAPFTFSTTDTVGVPSFWWK